MDDLRASLALRSFLLQAGFSDERRQGLGFAWAIDTALRRAYQNDVPGLAAARARHLASFNAQPYVATLPLGVAASLEARAAAGEPTLAARAVALKATLGAALSGVADSFFWGALRPLAAAVALLGTICGIRFGARRPLLDSALVALAIFNVPALWVRWFGVSRGLSAGEDACAIATHWPVQVWIRAVRSAAAAAIVAVVWAALSVPMVETPRLFAVVALVSGAVFSRYTYGPLRLIAAAGFLGAVACAVGWGRVQ